MLNSLLEWCILFSLGLGHNDPWVEWHMSMILHRGHLMHYGFDLKYILLEIHVISRSPKMSVMIVINEKLPVFLYSKRLCE